MTPTPAQILIVKTIAQRYSLDWTLVCALIEQESDWDASAIRYEPLFMTKYVAPLFTTNKISATEAYARSFSWGAMQIMGQTAREMGFAGPYLAALADFATGVEYGCIKLAKCLQLTVGDKYAALSKYNGGGAPDYPQQVINRLPHYLEVTSV